MTSHKFLSVSRCLSYVTAVFTAIAITSCGFNDEGEDTPAPTPGTPFPDVEASYILSPETESASVLPGDGSVNNPYLIRNAMELKLFTELVNSGEFKKTEEDVTTPTHVCLTHDIKIADNYTWTPIGSCEHPFEGTFDGQGHCISGALHISATIEETIPQPETGITWGTQKAGFFGYAENADIGNIRISADTHFPARERWSYCGGLVAISSNTSIHNITYDGTIHIPTTQTAFMHQLNLGGIAGYMITGFFYNNEMNGRLQFGTPDPQTKKILGEHCNIGGLIGTEQSTDIQNSKNVADINIDAGNAFRLRVGGIVGYRLAYGEQPKYASLTRVENKGDITIGKILETSMYDQSPMVYAGGIYGDGGEDSGEYGNMVNCGNITVGETRITSYAGGIAGMAYKHSFNGAVKNGRISNSARMGCTGGCYGYAIGDVRNMGNSGDVISKINKGKVEDGNAGYTGGIAGHVSGRIERCNNEGAVSSGKDLDWGGVPVSRAGAIAGRASMVTLDNTNTGTVNGKHGKSPSDPTVFIGELWLAWDMILDGTLTPQSNPAGFTRFHDKISKTFFQYQWPLY